MSRFCILWILPLLAASTARAQDARPNILFAISDDQSWRHTSAGGCKSLMTPAFDRVAKLGARFTNAIASSPGCSPCRASILTGRHIWQIEHAGTHASYFDRKYTVFPDLLEKTGYQLGATGKLWGPGNWKKLGFKRNPAGPVTGDKKNQPPYDGMRNTDYAANFSEFVDARDKAKPFFFWFGASEPHRVFEKGSGLKSGKKLADAEVPPFLPDRDEIRSDILDYCVEIEWFDTHLGRMLDKLEKLGQLDNTLVVVTSDNGMAFPRAKANCYEYGIHLPLAMASPSKAKGQRVVDDLVQFVDFAPTFLEAANVAVPDTFSGRSLLDLLESGKSGQVDPSRTVAYSARERHSSSRWNNNTYPQRAIRTPSHLLIWNPKAERWPAGAPQKFDRPGELGKMHGGYHDIDACPSLTYLIENRDDPGVKNFFHLSVDKRPEYELFDIAKDPGNLTNIAGKTETAEVEATLKKQLHAYLKKTGDARALGNGDVWETYKRVSSIRKFPKPDWAR